jgi:Zn finger protein HypA/HybF involved in hydrogenase expression
VSDRADEIRQLALDLAEGKGEFEPTRLTLKLLTEDVPWLLAERDRMAAVVEAARDFIATEGYATTRDLGGSSEMTSETYPTRMLCHSCEQSARQWGYYTAQNEEDEEFCPICGSEDVSVRPTVEESVRE